MTRYRTIGERERAEHAAAKAVGARKVRPTVEHEGRQYPACRFCAGPVRPPRRTFCSGDRARFRRGVLVKPGTGCVHEWLLRSNAAYMRLHVGLRDGGVCAVCGTDTVALRAIIRVYNRADSAWATRPDSITAMSVEALGYRVRDLSHVRSLWEADHVVPVVEGGGECGVDDVRTLCLVCHRRATSALAKRRAERRRIERAILAAADDDAEVARLAALLDAMSSENVRAT